LLSGLKKLEITDIHKTLNRSGETLKLRTDHLRKRETFSCPNVPAIQVQNDTSIILIISQSGRQWPMQTIIKQSSAFTTTVRWLMANLRKMKIDGMRNERGA
jgi:hypothetical protein